MSEDQIECKVERMTDRVDALFMRGELTQEEYDTELKRISEWAESEYSKS